MSERACARPVFTVHIVFKCDTSVEHTHTYIVCHSVFSTSKRCHLLTGRLENYHKQNEWNPLSFTNVHTQMYIHIPDQNASTHTIAFHFCLLVFIDRLEFSVAFYVYRNGTVLCTVRNFFVHIFGRKIIRSNCSLFNTFFNLLKS